MHVKGIGYKSVDWIRLSPGTEQLRVLLKIQ
jgi:hypothetical protein